MKAEVVSMTAENLDMEAIRRGGEILKQGGLVAFPTETVYGLGGDALNPQASMKIYAAKGRSCILQSLISWRRSWQRFRRKRRFWQRNTGRDR